MVSVTSDHRASTNLNKVARTLISLAMVKDMPSSGTAPELVRMAHRPQHLLARQFLRSSMMLSSLQVDLPLGS